MKTNTISIVLAVSAALMACLRAQVTVNGAMGSPIVNANGITTSTYTYTLANPGASNVIVAGYYNDNDAAITGMTFGGVAATKFATQSRTAIGCYILPSPAPATITITATLGAGGNQTTGFFIYELGKVDTSGGAASIDTGTGATITTTGNEKFIVNFKSINNSSGAGTVPAAGSIIPPANAGIYDMNGGGGGGAMCRGYTNVSGPAGTKTLGWTAGASGEVSLAFVQAGNPDTDNDNLPDVWELSWTAITNLSQLTGLILNPVGPGDGSGDWDGDGVSDFAELEGGSDPTNPASVPGDIDGDGLPDAAELLYFGNLSQGPDGDYDGDHASNAQEIAAGTSPTNASLWPDTDGDGMSDAWEMRWFGNLTTADSALRVGGTDTNYDGDPATDLAEFRAATDPKDAAWWPGHAVLAHRWSFNGDLTDSVGGSDAQIVNDNPLNAGLSSSQDSTFIRLNGGAKATSDYVLLGENLLGKLQSGGVTPVTIELWATQEAIQNWARIFAFGVNDGTNPTANRSLRMTWLQGTNINAAQVSWEPTTSWDPGTYPFVIGVPHHIVMTIEPALSTNGALASGARVTWYSAPASSSQAAGHPLYAAKGSFNTNAGVDLRALLDSACTLGRSLYPDNTASASYDEVRIWKGALSDTERKLFQFLGPENFDRTDSEPDGLPDAWEMAIFGNLTTATTGGDADADGQTDDFEFFAESNPNNILSVSTDADADGLPDNWERQYFRNLLQLPTDDPDGDFSDNAEELAYGSNPTDRNSSPDTDGDGLPDGWERLWFGDLVTADSTLRTGGTDTNYDGDFDTDREEYLGGWNPTNRFSGRDLDADGLPDYWEYFYFFPVVGTGPNPNAPLWRSYNGSNDFDGDTATNAEEFADATDPADPNSFRDSNGDGLFDGFPLIATDGFGASSFNAGTNWQGAQAPVALKNYFVPGAYSIRTPNTANANVTFAGSVLAVAGGLWLKGDNATFNANYVFANQSGTPFIRQAVDAGGLVTLGGTISIRTDTNIISTDPNNGPLAFAGPVSGSGNLNLSGNSTAVREVRFNHTANTWTGNIILQPTASLIVNGTLSPGAESIYHIVPRAAGVNNRIGGSGTISLNATLNIDLSSVVLSEGASWSLVTTAEVNYGPGFTVADSAALVGGFTPSAGAAGERTWTSGNGDYQFDERNGVLSFIGTVPGYTAWAANKGLTAGVNDGPGDNPDGDPYINLLEYQLRGTPLTFDGNLVTITDGTTDLIFTFERFDASENDTTLNFRWSTNLATWNTVPVGPTNSGPNAHGVTVTVIEDGGATTDYDLIEIRLPKSNAVGGKLFGQLQGTQP